jgi:hypothetical protein
MDEVVRNALWLQLGAAIESLENAIRECPDELWGDLSNERQFWYLAYHTLFFLDYYSSETAEGFAPPEPFTMSEADPAGILPPRVYTRAELLKYLEHGREKCRRAIAGMTVEGAREILTFPSIEGPAVEIHLTSMRHVQHHTAQLNLLMRQTVDRAPRWVKRASRG